MLMAALLLGSAYLTREGVTTSKLLKMLTKILG